MSAPWPPPDETSPVQVRTGGAVVASGITPNSSVLAGRGHELMRIDALLSDASAGRSGALLIVGEPGSGKDDAAGGGAGAGRFVHLPRHARHRGRVTPGVRRAVRFAQPDPEPGDRPHGPPGDRARCGAGLVERGVDRRPIPAGCRHPLTPRGGRRAPAGAGAGGRLGSGWTRSPRPRSPSLRVDSVRTPSPFLLAAREGTAARELSQGLPVLPVSGLSTSAAAMLLPTRAAPGVVDRLVAATQGNPLALVEVAARLDDAQWLGAAELPDPVPSGDRLREHFRTTLAELSPAARTAVLYLALVGDAGSDALAVAHGAWRCRHQRR